MTPRPSSAPRSPADALRPHGKLLRLAAAVALAVPAPACAQADASGPRAARDAYGEGRYEAAISAYRTAVRDADIRAPGAAEVGSAVEAYRGLARSLAAVGRYGEAIDALDSASGADAVLAVELARELGELRRTVGRLEEAEAAFRRAVDGGASDALRARLGLAELLRDRGEREAAAARLREVVAASPAASSAAAAEADAGELAAAGRALALLGQHDPDLVHAARRAFEAAIRAAPADPAPKVALGELFLARYNSRDAGELFREVLERAPTHPEALLGMARRARFDGSAEALEHARRSLETNPHLVPARTFLAELYLELEDVERAEAEARRALDVNPASRGAWTALAAAAHLRGDAEGFEEARRRVLALDPRYAELYDVLAEVSYRGHRYGDAVAFAQRGTELDPSSWSSHALLGLNLLRVGRMEEGRAALVRAFDGDPFNVWVKNTLDLLDVLEGFRETGSARFRFLMEADEAELLTLYAAPLAEEAFEHMSARYGRAPSVPIRVEVYGRHADFSVRTVGLAGMGALGVSFGSVLAMDSPGARERGEFNWASTLWHELSHAFTLAYTDHRVPRWLSEGLAVQDQRRARKGWGADPSPDFLLAFREERLPTLERFNYGFVRPAYPGQVQHSYILASLLCEMIEEEEGLDALRRMLDGYREGWSTGEVFRRVLGTDLAAADARLRAYVRSRFGPALDALGGGAGAGGTAATAGGRLGRLILEGARLWQEGRPEAAIDTLERAKAVFPEYAGPDAPTLQLGRIHRERGDLERAAVELRAYTALNENHYDARLELADLEEALGRPEEEARALEGALWIDPYEPALHERLATLYEAAARPESAVRERRAVLALDPVDRARALFLLARAYRDAGRPEEARRTVVEALEIAPGYDEALDLLLRLREAGGPTGTGGGA